jgi:opacity protein-like surface antigen
MWSIGGITVKRVVMIGTAIAALAGGSAFAADMPLKAPQAPFGVSWAGFYVGLNGGWVHERFGWTYTHPVPFIPSHSFGQDNPIIGAHVGYNLQFQQLVLGVEAALSTPTAGDFAVFVPCAPAASPTSQCQARVQTVATVGGRLGWATGSWLFYGSGGWASATAKTRELTSPPTVFDVSTTHRHNGFYVGGGIEYQVTSTMVFGVEYQRVELDTRFHASSADLFGPSPPGVNGRNIEPTLDIVRARLSVKLGP